jgi:hypothetical protein
MALRITEFTQIAKIVLRFQVEARRGATLDGLMQLGITVGKKVFGMQAGFMPGKYRVVPTQRGISNKDSASYRLQRTLKTAVRICTPSSTAGRSREDPWICIRIKGGEDEEVRDLRAFL